MTSRRLLTLEAIKRHFAEYGCAPSFGELRHAIDAPPSRISGILRQLADAGLIGFVRGRTRSITLPRRLAMVSTSELLLEIQTRGLLVRVVAAETATAGLGHVYSVPGGGIAADIVTELELSEQAGNDDITL